MVLRFEVSTNNTDRDTFMTQAIDPVSRNLCRLFRKYKYLDLKAKGILVNIFSFKIFSKFTHVGRGRIQILKLSTQKGITY